MSDDTYQIDVTPLRACVEGFGLEVGKANRIIVMLEGRISAVEADNDMLAELALKHGDHTEDCAYIEETASGRILENSEAEICDCGWAEAKKMLDKRSKKE